MPRPFHASPLSSYLLLALASTLLPGIGDGPMVLSGIVFGGSIIGSVSDAVQGTSIPAVLLDVEVTCSGNM